MYKMILEQLTVPGKQGNYKKNYWSHIRSRQFEGAPLCQRMIRAHKRIVTPMDGGISITYKSMSS